MCAHEALQLKLVYYFCFYTDFSLILYLVHALRLSRIGVFKMEVPLMFSIIGSEVWIGPLRSQNIDFHVEFVVLFVPFFNCWTLVVFRYLDCLFLSKTFNKKKKSKNVLEQCFWSVFLFSFCFVFLFQFLFFIVGLWMAIFWSFWLA